MKKLILYSLLLLSFFNLEAQDFVMPNRPNTIVSSWPGYITYNEFNAGIGLAETNIPYSKYFFGPTTIHGYQVNKSFVAAAGTGVLVYNEGTLIPLFLDFRYRFSINTLTPYLLADGGLLINSSDINATKLYINPGIGVRYSLSVRLGITFSTGLWIQNGGSRDTFIPFRLGVVYKPR